MLSYKLILNGFGGELDSHVVRVNADDIDGLRIALIRWLETERTVLSDGDTIAICTLAA